MYPFTSFTMPGWPCASALMFMVSGFGVEPECVTPTTMVFAVSEGLPFLLPVMYKLPFVPSPISSSPTVAGCFRYKEALPARFGPAAPMIAVHAALFGALQLYSLPLTSQTQFVLPPVPNQDPVPPFQ